MFLAGLLFRRGGDDPKGFCAVVPFSGFLGVFRDLWAVLIPELFELGFDFWKKKIVPRGSFYFSISLYHANNYYTSARPKDPIVFYTFLPNLYFPSTYSERPILNEKVISLFLLLKKKISKMGTIFCSLEQECFFVLLTKDGFFILLTKDGFFIKSFSLPPSSFPSYHSLYSLPLLLLPSSPSTFPPSSSFSFSTSTLFSLPTHFTLP